MEYWLFQYSSWGKAPNFLFRLPQKKTAGVSGRGFWKGENKKPPALEATRGFTLCYMIRLVMAGTPPSGSCATTKILQHRNYCDWLGS